MATTKQLVRAITQRDYPSANKFFMSLVKTRMEQLIQQRYHDEAKTWLAPRDTSK